MSKTETKPISKWYVKRLRLNSGGYTSSGIYYGTGQPLYECFNDDFYHTFRADNREHAIEQLRDMYKFYNLQLWKE